MQKRTAIALLFTISWSGCATRSVSDVRFVAPKEFSCATYADGVEYPDVNRCGDGVETESLPPRSMADGEPADFWDLPLAEVIETALRNSPVLRELGGRILASPEAMTSIYDPAISQSHPRLGEEAALSAFDAQFQYSALWNDSDLPYNNFNTGGGAFEVKSDQFRSNAGLTKTSATGAQYGLTSFTRHLHSDAPSNRFSHAWTNGIEVTLRQPLLQGAGVGFNRIARPGSGPEVTLSPGVLLARINTDLSATDFERGVRDFVSQLEDAYWSLYQSYRTLDANRTARDTAHQTWTSVKTRFDAGLRGGEADTEAQAREQLYLFEQQVLLSLDGDSSSGRAQSGVYPSERRLRQLMGLPVNDGRLIRPSDEPTEAAVKFDWECSLLDALARRSELRRQLWSIKQRELELIAVKNFLLPRLDLVASARTEGLGDDLFGGTGSFESSVGELFSFEHYDATAGVQFSVPLGFRREMAAARHAELNLCRARAVLREQEKAIAHELGEAIADVQTTFTHMDLSYNRMLAAEQVVRARFAAFDAGKVAIDALLEAQRRWAQARIDYFQSRVSHVLAIKNVHLHKGTLLPYNGVALTEEASNIAVEGYIRERRHEPRCLQDYRITTPCDVSLGAYDASIDATCQAEAVLFTQDIEGTGVEEPNVDEPNVEEPNVEETQNGDNDGYGSGGIDVGQPTNSVPSTTAPDPAWAADRPDERSAEDTIRTLPNPTPDMERLPLIEPSVE